MSMNGGFQQITPDQLQIFLNDESGVEDFLMRSVMAQYSSSLPAKLDHPSLSVDKAWHGIHFLLTGQAWEGDRPLYNVILGGTPMGDDMGYGPARYLTPAEVTEVADSIREIGRDQLAEKFDSDAFKAADIYPSIWDEGGTNLDYLLRNYEELQKYYLDAAEKGNGMLLYLT